MWIVDHERIKSLRTIPLHELAKATGISKSQLHDIEMGKKQPTAGRLKQLSEYYNVPLECLFRRINMRKWEFTGETKEVYGVTVQRIRFIVAWEELGVSIGDLGGWIQHEENIVGDEAWVGGEACVVGKARVGGEACVGGKAWVGGEAWVMSVLDIITLGYVGSRNDHLTAHRTETSVQINVGCYQGLLTDFTLRVEETHKENNPEIYKQYMAIVEVIKIRFGVEASADMGEEQES